MDFNTRYVYLGSHEVVQQGQRANLGKEAEVSFGGKCERIRILETKLKATTESSAAEWKLTI